jgi:hypothetical protein
MDKHFTIGWRVGTQQENMRPIVEMKAGLHWRESGHNAQGRRPAFRMEISFHGKKNGLEKGQASHLQNEGGL